MGPIIRNHTITAYITVVFISLQKQQHKPTHIVGNKRKQWPKNMENKIQTAGKRSRNKMTETKLDQGRQEAIDGFVSASAHSTLLRMSVVLPHR